MAEKEFNLECDSCGSSATIVYDSSTGYHPEICPFCGEMLLENDGEDEDVPEYDEDIDDYESLL